MAGRQILLVGDNFGAGSSREHAPWALTAWGIRAILSTSFADIFRSNSLKNGVLPIVVDAATHARLFGSSPHDPDAELTIDLAEQGVLLPDGATIDFDIDPFAKRMILAGHGRARLPPLEGGRDRGLGGGPPAADRLARRDGLSGIARRGHAGRGGVQRIRSGVTGARMAHTGQPSNGVGRCSRCASMAARVRRKGWTAGWPIGRFIWRLSRYWTCLAAGRVAFEQRGRP